MPQQSLKMAAKTSQTSTLGTARAETTITSCQTEALLLSKRVSKIANVRKNKIREVEQVFES